MQEYSVTLTKGARGLGFTIAGSAGRTGLFYVKEVLYEPALSAQQIRTGDRLVKVRVTRGMVLVGDRLVKVRVTRGMVLVGDRLVKVRVTRGMVLVGDRLVKVRVTRGMVLTGDRLVRSV